MSRTKNKTRKKTQHKYPELKILPKEYIIYGAKPKHLGANILEYTRRNENKKHTHCVYENISWFAGLEQAKHYNVNMISYLNGRL